MVILLTALRMLHLQIHFRLKKVLTFFGEAGNSESKKEYFPVKSKSGLLIRKEKLGKLEPPVHRKSLGDRSVSASQKFENGYIFKDENV